METLQAEPSVLSKAVKRFIFCYLVLYIFPYGFEYIYALDTDDLSFWTKPTQWFGETFLGLTYDPERLMKGFDSKYDYTRFLLCAVLSLIIATGWLVIDRKYQLRYESKLNSLLRAVVRYHTGLTMIVYGMAKVLPLQFGDMGIDRLESTIGQYSPMGFLWAFMSHSKFYTASAGLIEVIGGVLLLFRRTTLLGAVICFTAMANVVLMDIGYDVSVKMFAIHLLLMTILLMADDAARLMKFFVLNQPTQPVHYAPLFTEKRTRMIGYVLKTLIIGYFTVTTVNMLTDRMKNEHDHRNDHVSGIYKIRKFVVNGDTLPPLGTDAVRWKNFILSGTSYMPDKMMVRYMTDSRAMFTFSADTLQRTLVFHSDQDSTDRYVMKYERLPENIYVLSGLHKQDSIWIEAEGKASHEYQLTRSGVRWIRDL
ncbi:hypothetical protein KK083_03695 [Fulvivirgaceae bacterium PWU4]|uniref:DoxX family protein n=1 Tax=Chryseosolibacter histidini TaxID=2782349 RepID=A0AAP2GMP2_9BACT|nr:hypothetical protein [Chryseosolibacter histidini]MBT1695965.1 hypothetical protein [Chryseosolibacter histidini]